MGRRMFRLTYWRPLGQDGKPFGSPDMMFCWLDSVDDRDWSDLLDRAWTIERPSKKKKRKAGTVLALPNNSNDKVELQ
jgi:hypothetical protein